MRRAVLMVVVLAGCGSGDKSVPPNVSFGLIIDLTGSIAHPQWNDAAAIAIGHANDGLDLAGDDRDIRFGLRLADSQNLSKITVDRAGDLIGRGSKAVVVDTSENAVANLRTVYDTDTNNDIAVPVICIACTSPELGDPAATVPNRAEESALRNEQRWGFRTSTSSDAEAMLLLKIARGMGDRGDVNGDAINKLGLEIVKDLDGTGFLRGIEKARPAIYPQLIVEVVRHSPEIDVDAHDWNDDLVRLTNDRNEERSGAVDGPADVILEATYPLYAASLTRAYLEAGAQDTPFLHHHNWRHDQTLIKLSTFDIEGHEGVSHAIVDNCDTSGTTFWRAIEERTGRGPSLFDAQTYDAVMLLALAAVVAIEEHGVTPQDLSPGQLRDALQTLSAIPAGDPRFDATLEASRVPVDAGAEGFKLAVETIRGGLPIDYVGASGPVDFDEYGNVGGNFVRYRVEQGRFVDVVTYECLVDPAECPASTKLCKP